MPTRESKAEMYRLAYEESKRTLDDQIDELTGMRTRVLAYLAFVGTATAFLVGTALRAAFLVGTNLTSVHRDWVFYLLSGSGTVGLLLTLGFALALLVPRHDWNYRISGKSLVTDWIESDVPPTDEVHLMRVLTFRYEGMREANETVLAKLRPLYIAAIAIGTLQLILWMSLAWVVG